jgi:hypothetical protein
VPEDQTIGTTLGEAEACLLYAIISIRYRILGIQGQCSTCIDAKLVKNALRPGLRSNREVAGR